MTIADIVTKSRKLVDADSNSYTDANLLIDINSAYEEIAGKILGFDGRWQFDDTNFTDLPQGKANLVASQHDYGFDSTHLVIEKVGIKDADGNYYWLSPIDKDEYSKPLDEIFDVDGKPSWYDKDGSSVFIYPAPASGSVTTSEGLLVHFRRTADIFTAAQVTTGTKTPGFASPFHKLLCYKTVLDYAMSYKKDRVAVFMAMIKDLEDKMEKFYSKRERDEKPHLTMGGIAFR